MSANQSYAKLESKLASRFQNEACEGKQRRKGDTPDLAAMLQTANGQWTTHIYHTETQHAERQSWWLNRALPVCVHKVTGVIFIYRSQKF